MVSGRILRVKFSLGPAEWQLQGVGSVLVEWWFSIIEVVEVLVGGDRPGKYWNNLKTKRASEGHDQLSEKIGQLKWLSRDDTEEGAGGSAGLREGRIRTFLRLQVGSNAGSCAEIQNGAHSSGWAGSCLRSCMYALLGWLETRGGTSCPSPLRLSLGEDQAVP